MRPYETLVVLHPSLGDETARLIARFETVIQSEGGSLDANRDWGLRRLAYPIHKQQQGHYYLIEYQGEPNVVKELERNLRISEGVLRFVSVQQDHTGLPEPRVREYGDRRDVPLSELRSQGDDRREEGPSPDDAGTQDVSAPADAEPQETAEEA